MHITIIKNFNLTLGGYKQLIICMLQKKIQQPSGEITKIIITSN